jgi:hypothetical protein
MKKKVRLLEEYPQRKLKVVDDEDTEWSINEDSEPGLEHPQIEHSTSVATHLVPTKEDPCQTLESTRRRNHCNMDTEELNQVRLLIDRVVKEFKVDDLGMFACRIYDYNIELYVHLVRQFPTLVNVGDGEYTTLHCAAAYQPQNVPILIELGAPINSLTRNNKTSLDEAYMFIKDTAVRVLLKNGASTMIGERMWLSNEISSDRIIVAKLIRRSYYLSLFSHMEILLSDHLRNVVDMLV